MAMGRSGVVQDDLMATWSEMPRLPGHAFYDRLQEPYFRSCGRDHKDRYPQPAVHVMICMDC